MSTAFAMAAPLCGTITSTSTPRLISAWTSLICRVSSLLADWTKTSAPSSLRARHKHIAISLPALLFQRVHRKADQRFRAAP